MGKSFHLQLRAGELLYVNGAALRVDRRVSVEVLNDVTFLLGSHILPASEATTPLKQLYFALQMPLLEPAVRLRVAPIIMDRFAAAEAACREAHHGAHHGAHVATGLSRVRALYANGRNFEALKILRTLFVSENVPPAYALESAS